MPAWGHYGPYTGSGRVEFDGGIKTVLGLIYDVTDPGGAWSLDVLDPHRFMKVGWIALFDNYTSDGTVPDGDYFHHSIWLEYLKGWIEDRLRDDNTTASSGFFYSLQDGVECDFYFWY